MVQMERAVVLMFLLAVCHVGDAFPQPEGALGASAPHPRFRRQFPAMSLAGDHSNRAGHNRPVGQLHGFVVPHGAGTLPNYSIGATAGVGSVLWRSPNQQHSVGLGATVDHTMSSYGGIRNPAPLNLGAGIGYRWRF